MCRQVDPKSRHSNTSQSETSDHRASPGTKVHASGIPWNDASGILLRKWLGMETADFYDETKVAIVPMGFCYPGKGKTGDLPPKKICATTWHQRVLESLPEARLLLLIGSYAQKYYLKDVGGKTLTENVGNFEQFLPTYFPLPHPSPRNRFWMQKISGLKQKYSPNCANKFGKYCKVII